MDKVNLLIYSYPREQQYSVVSDYDGDIIADYAAEITKQFPAIGDTRTYSHHVWQDGECKLLPTRWTVAQVSTWERISIVQLTLDGKPAELEEMNPEQVLQIIVTPAQIKLSWPTKPEYGVAREDVTLLESFHPSNCWQIQVCWCMPVETTESNLVTVA